MNNIIRNLFTFMVFLSFFCFAITVNATNTNIVLDHITVEDGLTQASVLSLAQDKQGYMWFGTENGINIYDGYSFSTLLGPDDDFNRFMIKSIYIARDGLAWINVIKKGLYTFNPANNEYKLIIKGDPEDKSLRLLQVIEDSKNNLFWLITNKTALSYDLQSNTILRRIDFSEHLTNSSNNSTDNIYKASIIDNRLLLASPTGLVIYDITSEKTLLLPKINHNNADDNNFDETESRKIYDITRLEEYYYIGTNDGVFRFLATDLEKYSLGKVKDLPYELVIKNTSVWSLITLGNTVYTATSNGLYRFNSQSHNSEFLFQFGDYYKYVSDKAITAILADNNGQLWFSSETSGAYRWDPATEIITNYVHNNLNKNSLSNSSISTMIAEPNNMLWVGTNNGLNLIDIDQNKVTRFLENNNEKTTKTRSYIYEAEKDYLGRLWLLTANGLVLFDTKTKKIIPTNFPEQTQKLLNAIDGWVSFACINEYIWLISNNVLYKIHALTGELTRINIHHSDFKISSVWHIMESFTDDPNDILISTTDTLWLYNDLNEKLTSVFHQEGLPQTGHSYIDQWERDSRGLIWLSYTQVGLLAISLDTYQVEYFFNEYNSILDRNIYGVQRDEADNIWVSSHAGLFRLNVKTNHLRKFEKRDGLSNIEFNYGAFSRLADGRFVYGGISGLSVFDPVKLGNTNQNTSHSVSIVKVDTLSRPLNSPHAIPKNHRISLAHDDVGIRIDFSSFSFKQSPFFKYGFLNGVTFPETKQNFVTFPRLDSGEHEFYVQVKSPVTGKYSTPAIVHLDVQYAPWKSPLAIALYIISIILALTIFFRHKQLRQRSLLAAHKEVIYRENRLQLALSASNSDVWDWNAEQNMIFAKRLATDLGYKDTASARDFSHHLDIIHYKDQKKFLTTWQSFIANADAKAHFECTYRLRCADGHWLWYRYLGKIVEFDSDGKPLRVTGSYTNITDVKAIQERAQFYGAVFEQTRDWVLILDENLEIGRANRSMSEVFGWKNDELKLSKGLIGFETTRLDNYRKLLPIILEKGYWSGEEVIEIPNGQQYHVLTNISVSNNIDHQHRHFICVYTDITAQKVAENELRVMANYDHLTGLANRSLLLNRIEHAIASSSRTQSPIALFFIDLDRFKQVNDSLGHECGDLLLQEISKRLLAVVRKSDTLARIGGDEFVVLIEHFGNNNELAIVAQKLIDLVEQPFAPNNNVVSIGASIGISIYPNDAEDSEDLFRNADIAMYHAKQLGRNNYQFFTQHMNEEAKTQLSTETNLKLAFTNNEFFNTYQPIMDAHTGKSIGAELLLRWRYKGKVVPPIEFISLSEELGLIIPMTEQAIARGFKLLKQWRKQRPNYYLSVNFSAQHFSHNKLISSIKSLLKQYELPASALKIEITESAFIVEPDRAIKVMHELNDLGVLLLLDDFGTGFSSLSYLKKLPLDIIKIDRSFVIGIGNDKKDEAIIEATLVLAKRLDMYCVAEGVETKEQLKYLVERGCHFIQGYLYYKPLLASELSKKINRNTNELKTHLSGSDD